MKVLLCLLSDQHVPNLLSVHHYKPDQLVLIESSQMKSRKVSEHFLNALKVGGMDYEGRSHIEPLDAEDDLPTMRKALRTAYGRFSASVWITNVTGGTKPMSIAAYEFYKALGGNIIYTNVSRPAQIMNLVDGTTEDCNHRLTINEFLAGYGFESRKDEKKLKEAEGRAQGWAESATLLARHASNSEILSLDESQRKKARDRGIDLPKDRFHFPCNRLQEIWLGNSANRKLTKYEAEFLTGGWLEVFFWKLLKQHAEPLGHRSRQESLGGYVRLSRNALLAAGWLKRYVEALSTDEMEDSK